MSEKQNVSSEILNAWMDSVVYGTGFFSITPDKGIKHVPFKKVIDTIKEINEQLNDSAKLKEDEK